VTQNLQQPIEERELALAMREAELNRREAALRRAEEARADDEGVSDTRASSALQAELEVRIAAAEARERELAQTIGAVESQRARLEAVRGEYESRREALKERSRELEAERDRLRAEQARLVTASMELDDRERAAAARAHALDPPAPVSKPADADWWAKQLGAPLEAA
jgi:chromosome segregation ATPase